MKNIPVKEIPEESVCFWKFDLTQVKEHFWINFAAMMLMFLTMIFCGFLIYWQRFNELNFPTHYVPPKPLWALKFFATMFGTVALMVPIHEGIHGIFYWIFTRTRPRFIFKHYYAFVSAPGWYFPRWQYFFIGLSPLVMITALCILGIIYLPIGFVLPLYLLVIFNCGGSIGDLWVAARLLVTSRKTMIRDFGEAIEFYSLPAEKPAEIQ